MALLSLIFDKPKRTQINVGKDDGTERELLILDMTTNISHGNEVSITENPIESGATIGDHVQLQPKIVSFEGIMSSAPITLGQAIVGNVAGVIPAIGGFGNTLGGALVSGAVATLGGLLLNGGDNRVQEALNSMLEIQEKAILVTLITGLRSYNNMILQSFQPIENAQIGDSLSFTATFKEVSIVQSEQIILSGIVLAANVANKASSTQKLGKKQANVSTKGSSLLSKLTGLGA